MRGVMIDVSSFKLSLCRHFNRCLDTFLRFCFPVHFLLLYLSLLPLSMDFLINIQIDNPNLSIQNDYTLIFISKHHLLKQDIFCLLWLFSSISVGLVKCPASPGFPKHLKTNWSVQKTVNPGTILVLHGNAHKNTQSLAAEHTQAPRNKDKIVLPLIASVPSNNSQRVSNTNQISISHCCVPCLRSSY